MSQETIGEVKEKIDVLLGEEYVHFQQFEKIVRMINDNNRKVVFLLDEFEKISTVKYSDALFSRLRYLAQMYDVIFVTSTLYDLRYLYREERFSTSPFFNIFTEYQLHGLDKNAARELITVSFQRGGTEIDSLAIDPIIKSSGTIVKPVSTRRLVLLLTHFQRQK